VFLVSVQMHVLKWNLENLEKFLTEGARGPGGHFFRQRVGVAVSGNLRSRSASIINGAISYNIWVCARAVCVHPRKQLIPCKVFVK
jgi:hypothetical protein